MFPYDELKFKKVDGIEGLVTVIAQDFVTNDVLMVAWANKDAIEKTLETGKVHYYSTSRGKIWLKGETSGNTQDVKEILIDCDGDVLLIKVKQIGGACHTGYRSCFYRKFNGEYLEDQGEKVFNPEKVY